MRSTMASTCSWEKLRNFCQAACAFSTLVRTSCTDRRSLSASMRPLLLHATGGEDLFDLLVGPGNHMNADQLADAACGSGAGIGRGLDGAHIAAALHHDQSRAHDFLAGEDDVGGLHHRVRGFNRADKSFS